MKIRSSILFLLCFTPVYSGANNNQLKLMALELADGIKTLKNAKTVVLSVPYYDNFPSDGSQYIADQLETYLVMDKRLSLLNRQHVSQILEEQHLSQTGITDLASSQKMGKMLGADLIITGTLIDVDHQQTEVNLRALNPDTGRIIVATRGLVERTWRSRATLRHATHLKSSLEWRQ